MVDFISVSLKNASGKNNGEYSPDKESIFDQEINIF